MEEPIYSVNCHKLYDIILENKCVKVNAISYFVLKMTHSFF